MRQILIAFLSIVSLLASPANGQRTLQAWELTPAGDINAFRLWYGDGALYTGPTIPGDVKNVFNLTVIDGRNELLYLQVDKSNSAPGAGNLPDPSFVVVNTKAGAKDSLYLAHSAVGFTHDNIYLFANMDGFWYPRTRSSISQGLPYIVPTGTEGTYTVRWIMNEADANALKGRRVDLTTR